jgi:hypothetical protein
VLVAVNSKEAGGIEAAIRIAQQLFGRQSERRLAEQKAIERARELHK